MAAIQLDGAKGYGLPLKVEALAHLNDFEVDCILGHLDLDADQRSCAEQAIAAVRDGTYGEVGR